jgi:hypothetical protein
MTVALAFPDDDAINASETAQAVARMLPHSSGATVEQLGELLRSELARLSPARDREANLGLLCELLMAGREAVEEYERERAARAEIGEQWPSPKHLTSVYRGHWLHVVEQARRHLEGGTTSRVKSDHRNLRPCASYTRDEVLWAVERCRRTIGNWPTEWEFAEWCRLERRLQRLTGKARQRTPVPKVVRTLFGSYARLRHCAERWDPSPPDDR